MNRPDALRSILQHGFSLLRNGQSAQAEQAFRSVLDMQPDQTDSLHGLSRALEQLGRHDEAIACSRRAVAVAPDHPGLQYNLGVMLQGQGAIGSAQIAFAEAVRLKPDFFQAWNNLGLALQDLGQIDEAIEAFGQALAVHKDYPQALGNLGNALAIQGRRDEALSTFRSLRTLLPDDPGARRKEALALIDLGRTEQALALLQEGTRHAAMESLAQILIQRNDAGGAAECFRDLCREQPGNWIACIGQHLSLPFVYASEEAVVRARARFTAGLEALHALAGTPSGSASDILHGVERENFLLAYQGENDRELQTNYAQLTARLLHPLVPDCIAPIPRDGTAGTRKLRIGFASALLRDCTVGHYFKSWITDLDDSGFETLIYALDGKEDHVSAEIRRHSKRYLRLDRPLPEIARTIRADKLDVLVFPELGMHGLTYALASLRLAPVQCAAWGHPVTSGHSTIDYFFSSSLMEPENGDTHYAETLLRLPGLGTRYEKPAVGNNFTRADFGLPDGNCLYLFPHAPFKIHPENDICLAQVLAADPEGMAVLFEGETRWMTEALLTRLKSALAGKGIAPDRLRVLPALPRHSYLEVNRLCDVMLDITRWSGGNTTLDALAAGLPIVTRKGRFMRGRQTAGMLSAIGLPELIARDSADYVRLAVELARNRRWRESIAEKIGRSYGAVFGDPEPIRVLEAFLRSLVLQP